MRERYLIFADDVKHGVTIKCRAHLTPYMAKVLSMKLLSSSFLR